jgi:RNA polymerase primary sigma factor
MDCYLREIDRTPLLNAEQEHTLALKVVTGDSQARDELARANLRLVVRIAREYVGRGLPLEDLISEGNIGLMRAVEGFDPSAGTRFSTYASFWVKQSIRVALNKGGYAVRLPQYVGTLMTKWRRTENQLRDQLGREPEREEIAAELGLSKRQVQAVLKAQKAVATSRGARSEETDLADLLPDARSAAPDEILADADDARVAMGTLNNLGEREATILKLRFGLEGDEPATLQEVGEKLGLTRERVRQLERESLAILRRSVAA